MEGRNGSAGLLEVHEAFSEEKVGLLAAHGRGWSGGGRHWSLLRRKCAKLNFLYFFLFGSVFLLGAVASLHLMGYFEGGLDLQEQWSSPSRLVELNPTTTKNKSLTGLESVDMHHSMTDEEPGLDPVDLRNNLIDEEPGLDPVDLLHNMTDQELFWRASIGPRRSGWAPPKSRKIAFMFLVRDSLPLAPLWEKYFRGGGDLYTIYVHSLPWVKLDVPPTSVFYRRQIPSQIARWGEVSLVDAARRLLANALLDVTNERFVLVSESGIPVHNLTTFYNVIIDSPVSFVNSFDSPDRTSRWNRKMEPEVDVEHWRKGSEWFEVKRSHAIFIVSDVRYYPKFRRFCKPGRCFPDEHYIPTILHMHFDAEISHFCLTFVDWSHPEGPHPVTFNETTVTEELLKRIKDDRNCSINGEEKQPCFFFARKFSADALEALLKLAPTVLGIT